MAKYVKICPKCGSTDITNVQANVGLSMSPSFLDFMKYRCKKCNYIGQMPEVKVEEVEEFRKKIKKKDKA